MTGSLGDFGTAHEAYEETFGYFGATIRVHPDLSDLALLEFAQMGAGLDQEGASGSDAIDAVGKMLRDLVHPDDYAGFFAAARANRQTINDLTDLAMKLIEAVAERPTQQSSGSSPGRPSTEDSSEADSSSRVVRRLEAQGRPDLALVVARSEEFLAG